MQKVTPDLQGIFTEALARHQAGHLADAERLYRHILEIDPRNAFALHLLGVLAHQAGQNDVAIELIHKAIAQNNQVPAFQNSLGNALKGQGKLEAAVVAYKKALARQPDMAAAHENLGAVLADQGKLEEAVASYNHALALQPDMPKTRSNLGSLLMELGRLDEAVACYRQALSQRPDLAEIHNCLGSALLAQGKPDEAAASFRQALTLRPDFVRAACNLALLFSGAGQNAAAFDIVRQILQHTEATDVKRIFVTCVKNMRWTQDESAIRHLMTRAVNEAWERPSELVDSAISLVMINPDQTLERLAGDTLLRALLVVTPLPNMQLERLLTGARHSLLEKAAERSEDDIGATLEFFGALARQCFINEYVYACTDKELQKAAGLRDALAAALVTGKPISALSVLAVAAYFPLSSIASASRLLEAEWPKAVTAVLIQQLREPQEEQLERRNIPRLTDIEDETSVLVREQYEENPYPRWVKMPSLGKPENLSRYLSYKFPLSAFQRFEGGDINTLIAGCGTGQQAIDTALRFQSSKILAIDLSLNSLGYAQRKTREMGINSIEYAQADILKLDLAASSFDVIESVGVLHHLSDPWAGWRKLLPLLRAGGVMHIGLYSEMARHEIVEIRNQIAQKGYGGTADEIRQFRQVLANSNAASFRTIMESLDFYSLSACRDLLFHVQEHRLTLTDIDAFLRENGLVFLGFDIETTTLASYRRRFPNDPAATNLAQWQIYENDHPPTFSKMYDFWVQKAGPSS